MKLRPRNSVYNQTEGLFILIDSQHDASYGIEEKGEKFIHTLDRAIEGYVFDIKTGLLHEVEV